jgi:hypothetical protein
MENQDGEVVDLRHAMSALLSPAREEAAWGRLLPSPSSFAPEFRIAISNSLPELSRNLLVFMGFQPTCGQKRVTHLFSSTHWEHFFALLFSIGYWEVSSFLTFFFHCPFVFNYLLGAILQGPFRLGSARLSGA